jgi:nucleotide-binding universal stress UspA family protein
MPRKILVPTDGSPLSLSALRYALSTFPDAEVTLAYVVEPWVVEAQPEKVFTEAARLAAARDRSAETVVLSGRPARRIVDYAEETGQDEVVIGSHGRDLPSRVLLGSVAERVVRRSPTPVTVVRADQEGVDVGVPSSVLVAMDGSVQSKRALEYALSEFPDASVTVLHAIDPKETHFGPDGQLVYTDEEYEEILDAMERIYEDAEEIAAEHDAEITTVTEVEPHPGAPVRGILDYLDDASVDHVVLGSHGREGVARVLLGSVAETVARRSPVPVTVVR